MTFKGQALVDFIVEFTYAKTTEVVRTTNVIEATKLVEIERNETLVEMSEEGDFEGKQWTLFVDRASNETGSRAGIILVSPEKHKIHCVIGFGFQMSNNEVEYEALLTRSRLAKELKVCHLKVYSNS